MTTTQASAIVTRCGEDVTEEYAASAFNWVRDSGDVETDNAWNAAHAGMKSITCTAADIDGDVKISCTLTASSASYGSITVDDDLDASHTPGELDANDVFVIEDGYLKVMTSRGEVYTLENGTLKAAGAKLNGSITAQTKLFASQPENIVEFSYDFNRQRTQKKVTKNDGDVEIFNYTTIHCMGNYSCIYLVALTKCTFFMMGTNDLQPSNLMEHFTAIFRTLKVILHGNQF